MASSEPEDEDLKAAIAMSLAQEGNGRTASSHAKDTATINSTASLTDSIVRSPKLAPGFLGLDRKAMEGERLARLGHKRERSVSPPPLRSPRKAPKLETNTVSLPSGARLTSFSTLVHQDQAGRKFQIANAATQKLKRSPSSSPVKEEPQDDNITTPLVLPQAALRYPKGVVKRTWAFGFERTDNDVKIEEVLEPLTLRTAVLSAFQWNVDWVLSKLKVPPRGGQTKCIFVMQGKEAELREQMLRETEGMRKFLRLCFPPMDGQIHCMHSKLMLLFHPNKLRIAMPTANLLNFDWGETGVMENSVFMIDLPRLPEGQTSESVWLTPFCKELMYFLGKQGLDDDVKSGVLNFDFSATQGMMFVHTVGGIHYGEDTERTGLPGLARAVRQLNLQTKEALQVDFAASSIGSLNDDFLRNVYAAARGEDMIARGKAGPAKAQADFFKPATKKSLSEGTGIRDKIRIYFPTYETVTSSKAGEAGTICLSRKWYEAGTFPKSCFRDYRSIRTGLLSHNKILYARGKRRSCDGEVDVNVAWAYVGSANMSESAWGKLVYSKNDKSWKINCRNWECGILLPVPQEQLEQQSNVVDRKRNKERVEGEDSETESEDGPEDSETECEDEGHATNGRTQVHDVVGMEVFEDMVPPPFETPGIKYDGRDPWYFKESN